MSDLDRELLRAERVRRGLTLDQVAATVGVADTSLVEYEHGIHRPSPETLARWMDMLGLSHICACGQPHLTISVE